MGTLQDWSKKAKSAASGVTAGAVLGGVVAGPFGAVLGGLAGSGAMGDIGPIGGNDPFGSKAEAKQKATAAELILGLEDKASSTNIQRGTETAINKVMLDKKSREQAALEQSSLDAFRRQQQLAAQSEADIAARAGLQEAGRGALSDIAGGEAFALSPEEQARIDQLRQTEIDVGSNEINRLLDQRLGELQANLAQRGVRGQAASQLQADVLGEGARSLESRILAANQNAAQQALALPGQRVGIQADVGQNLATFQDQARQQAIQNRQALQDPVLLQQLRDERLKTATTRTSGSKNLTSQQTGTQSAAGRTNALATLMGGPSTKQQDIAAGSGILGTVFKGAGAIAGAI